MRPERKRNVRVAGALASAGVLSWVVASNGPAQAGSPPDHDHDHDNQGTVTTVRPPDPREGSELFLPDGSEGPPGSKFRIGGRDCVEDYIPTVALVSVVHENGTRISVADGVTDDEGNWEVTAVIPEDMEDGDLSIEAGCFPDFHEVGVLGFAQAAPIFSYAGATFGVRTPDVPEDPDGGNGGDGGDGGEDGDGGQDGGAGSGGDEDGTGSGSESSGPAPAVSGDADFTG